MASRTRALKFRRRACTFMLLMLPVMVMPVMVLSLLTVGPLQRAATASDTPPATGPLGAGYAGSTACEGCHTEIYRRFVTTHMGRSLSVASPSTLDTLGFPLAGQPSATFDAALDRHFESYTRDGKLYQTEAQTDPDGKELFRDTRQVQWIIGSGMNGFGSLVERDHYLFQGPLSFYKQVGQWALSPGYESVDFGFNRPILAACIGCHSGRAQPIAATNGKYADPPFAEVAIGCENCHGPGSSHIQAMKSQGAIGTRDPRKAVDPLIVNPARLTPALANNICMSCHQTGDLRILKPGKTMADFRPGQPLDETLSIFMVPPTREAPPQEDHLEHYYSMTLSKCYRASQGRLGCISCHDPHVEPTRAEAPVYFRQKCLACHTEKSCTLPMATRQQATPADDCAGCHMPKRDVREIRHASITNHRILVRPDESFPDETFAQTTTALPDLIHLDPVPAQAARPVPAVTLLQAYGELSQNKPEYQARYQALLAQLERNESENVLVQTALGRRDLLGGKLEDAVGHFEIAIKSGPPQATTYGDLAEALTRLGRTEEGLAQLEHAVELDPFNPVLKKTLVLRYIQQKQYAKASAALQRYVELFPQDSMMRHMREMAPQ